MAIGAELLLGQFHPVHAFMLAVAIDAGARPGLAEDMRDTPQELAAEPGFGARERDPAGRGMIVHRLVAAHAGLVADRLERLDVTRLALGFELVMREAERTGSPRLVADHLTLLEIGRASEVADHRQGEEHRQHHGGEDP